MRKILIILIICFGFAGSSFSQNNYNWITPNKTYLKLFINDDGIYRIDRNDFTNAGVNPGSIDPRTVKLLYKGNQIPIFFQGEDDGTFDAADYFDFYGIRNSGGPTPRRDASSNQVVYTINEYYNLYSDTSSYWIDWGGSNGIRMENSQYVSPLNYPDDKFIRKVHFERDLFYNLGETTNPLNDFRYFSNEIVVGEGWFWKFLTTDESLEDTTYINDLSPTANTCSLRVFIKPVSFTNAISGPEHRIEVKINDVVVDTLYRDNLTRIDTTITFSPSFLTNNSSNKITFHYVPLGNQFFFPAIFIDFFELSYQRDFGIRNNNLLINLTGTDTTSRKFTVSNFNGANPVSIYDINNNIKLNPVPSGGVLNFTGKGNSSFVINNQNITKKPVRIVSRQVGDLVSAGNAADYLIVYNKLFESQVNQLKDHRTSFDNFRVFKAEVEDIYDVFNYGHVDPIAVRYFVKNVYDTWTLPKVKYVVLFGRASLDPKKSNPTSEYHQNFVPTYGNPPSDGYFANFNLGTYTYFHQISVGRIPVYNTTEAQNAVTKLITYDLQPPDKWWKKYIAITGGGSRSEQLNFQARSNGLIDTYITPPPISMEVAKIYRNDSTGYITYNYKDSIKREIDRGAQIINFIGHAAAQDWEIGLEHPSTLNNGNRQPLVLSFTCFTGKNSEPNIRSFGEEWFLLPNKCAIGFVGTTGWSFSGTGDSFNESIHKNFRDSTRRIGDLVTFASKEMSRDSNSFSPRNTINCYNLIGDPATKLLISNKPEFDLKQNEITLSNPFPSTGEQIKLTAYPKNLGTYVDTVRIRFQIRKNGVMTSRTDTMITTFGFIDTVTHFFTIDSIGNYSMTVAIDPNKNYSQNIYSNDSVTFALTLRNLSYVPIKPLDNVALSSGSFRFTGLNPNVDPGSNSIRLILQIDTSLSFNSPALQTYANNNVSGITTSFDVNTSVQELNTLYFLRTNAIINNDSSGWSVVSRVIYNPDVSDSKSADSVYTIFTLKPQQYNESGITNLNYSKDGFTLDEFTGNILIRSYGSNGNEASYFIINDITYYSDGGANNGLNVAKVKKLTGITSSIKNFRMTSPSSSDSVLNFLNTFDSTDYLLAYMTGNVFGGPPNYECASDTLSDNVKKRLRQFGSVYADSIYDFCRFTTWAFFGYLGADSTEICEGYHDFFSNFAWEPQNCKIGPEFQRTSGLVSQTVGTADMWKNFSWEQTLAPNSSVLFDVFGIDRDNVPIPLYENLTSNTFVNIDTLDPYVYPNLRLDTRLQIDTALGLESPVFKSATIRYVPPAELIPDNNSFRGGDTAVQEGDSVRFSVNYYNVGYIDAQVHINKWYANINGLDRIFALDTVYTPLKVDSMQTSSVSFNTAGLREAKLTTDTIDLFFETSLAGNRNEIFSYNNVAITRFVVFGDTIQPVMDITYDGIKIQNGDFVQSKPVIKLQFFDDSRMVISDTSNVKVYRFANNRYEYIPYYINGIKNPLIEIAFPDNNFLQATVTYEPVLEPGEHRFRFIATDISGNFADSITNTVIVDNNLRITEIANYPNPMKTETNFLFMLSGKFFPTSCKVKIFTLAGRVVREINASPNIGYNSIYWDGKDNDGDYIANGVYLYKFILQGDSQTETSIQKLAILR